MNLSHQNNDYNQLFSFNFTFLLLKQRILDKNKFYNFYNIIYIIYYSQYIIIFIIYFILNIFNFYLFNYFIIIFFISHINLINTSKFNIKYSTTSIKAKQNFILTYYYLLTFIHIHYIILSLILQTIIYHYKLSNIFIQSTFNIQILYKIFAPSFSLTHILLLSYLLSSFFIIFHLHFTLTHNIFTHFPIKIPFQQITRQISQSSTTFRVLIIGLDNSGKTTTLKSFLHENTSDIEPTLGFQIKEVKIKILNQIFHFNFWDVGGQRTIRAFWQNFYENTNGLIFVVDSSDKRRLKIAKETLNSLLFSERLQGAPVLILANKQDLQGALSVQEIQNFLGEFPSRVCKVFGCSAKMGTGVAGAFDWLVTEMIKVSDYSCDNVDDLELIW